MTLILLVQRAIQEKAWKDQPSPACCPPAEEISGAPVSLKESNDLSDLLVSSEPAECENLPDGCRVIVGKEHKDIAGQQGMVLRLAVDFAKMVSWREMREAWQRCSERKIAPSKETLIRYARRAKEKLGDWKVLFYSDAYGCEWRPKALMSSRSLKSK